MFGKGGFELTPEYEKAAHDHLTQALWRGGKGRRSGGHFPPMSERDKARIAGIVELLDRYVRHDLHTRRRHPRHHHYRSAGSARIKRQIESKSGGAGGCQMVYLPGGGPAKYLCDMANGPISSGALALPTIGSVLPSALGSAALAVAPSLLPGAVQYGANLLGYGGQPTSNFLSSAPGLVSQLGSYIGSGYNALVGPSTPTWNWNPFAAPQRGLLGQAGDLVDAGLQGAYNAASGALSNVQGVAANVSNAADAAYNAAASAFGYGDPWWKRALSSVSGLASSAFSALANGVSGLWGAFTGLISSAAGMLAAVPGWAFLTVPIAAAGVYIWYLRYAERPEASGDRKTSALLQKTQNVAQTIYQLTEVVKQASQIPDLQQAAMPALNRYIAQINEFTRILQYTPPNIEPQNSSQMLAELLTIETNLEALRQKLVGAISPQSAAIMQAQQQPSFFPPAQQQQQQPTFYPPQMYPPQMYQSQMYQSQPFAPPPGMGYG